MKNTLKCPHCFCELEVNAEFTKLSLRWVDGDNAKERERERLRDRSNREEQAKRQLPPPEIRDLGE